MVDPSLARYTPTTHVSGGFKVQGSDTMHALMRRLVSDFQVRQPKVTVDLRSGGSTKAISEFVQPPQPGRIVVKEERSNQMLLVSSSRELLDSEVKQFSTERGYEPLAIPIAVDAVALYVHKDNPLSWLDPGSGGCDFLYDSSPRIQEGYEDVGRPGIDQRMGEGSDPSLWP